MPRFVVGFSEQSEQTFIQDQEDYSDVRLYINGDFQSEREIRRYANDLAEILNKEQK